MAKILHELPHTRAAFVAGEVSEWRVMLVARATATLELADRVEVDARLAGQLAGMSDRRAEAAAKAIAYELDPMSPFTRARAAVSDRRVSVRPAPDVMALVTGIVPCAQGVAVKKALRQGAEAIYHAQTADDPRNRTLTQIEADLFVQRLTGQARAEDVDIEVGLVITDTATALRMNKAVAFRGMAHVQDFLPMSKRDILRFEGCTAAWGKALAEARLNLGDLSFVETHDCFTVAELLEYEAMGLTPEGQGARAIKEGWTQKDGKLPVNPSGGLKSKGHPIGATGVSMHVMSAMQLTGQAPEGMQLKNAQIAGIFNMGGAAVANYVSVLEAAK